MVASSPVHKIEYQFSEIARFVIAVTAAGAITRHSSSPAKRLELQHIAAAD
jgi:hypothetical protein